MSILDNTSLQLPKENLEAEDFLPLLGTDYVELYAKLNVHSGTVELDGRQGQGVFGAYRIIGA